jgi:GTPase SAR1 family protein
MFDLTNAETLTNLTDWIIEFRNVTGTQPALLVGGKSDLVDERICKEDDALNLMNSFNLVQYIESSSKTGENVNIIFSSLLSEILYQTGRSDIKVL